MIGGCGAGSGGTGREDQSIDTVIHDLILIHHRHRYHRMIDDGFIGIRFV
jgi:hypothetical protein